MIKQSYGIIPLAQHSSQWRVFLVSHRGYEVYWGCPKGAQIPGEAAQEAASRELTEETGLRVVRFLREEPFVETFTWDGVLGDMRN